jgi:hypothetical protein
MGYNRPMLIRHSIKLLEQLSELEEKIKILEALIQEKKLDVDSEELLRSIYEELTMKKY